MLEIRRVTEFTVQNGFSLGFMQEVCELTCVNNLRSAFSKKAVYEHMTGLLRLIQRSMRCLAVML